MLLGLQPISELHSQCQASEHFGRKFNLPHPCLHAFPEHEYVLSPPVSVEQLVSNYSSRTSIFGSWYLLISMMFYDVPQYVLVLLHRLHFLTKKAPL